MTTTSHEQLVHAAATGDDDALGVLIRLYHERVCRFGLRVCRDGFDADDAVQEAFMKLSQRPDVIADRGALSWLMTVVRHTCMRMLRPLARARRRLGEAQPADSVASDVDSPDQALARFEVVRTVHVAIAALPEVYRQVVILRDLEGLSGEQTSAALGIELATMKTRLHRARQLLKARLLHD